MPQSYAKIYVHTVFSTKYRRPFIHPEVEEDLYACLRHRLQKQGCFVVAIGGVYDHVHLLHSLSRTKSIAKILEDVKSMSSKWMRAKGGLWAGFAWQDGYSSFSVDYRKMEGVKSYVARQKQHHYGGPEGRKLRLSFEKEYQTLLNAYDCEYDPRYLFPQALPIPKEGPQGTLSGSDGLGGPKA